MATVTPDKVEQVADQAELERLAKLAEETEQQAAESEPELDEAEPSYPRAWLWNEDGDIASGTFVKADRAPTKDFGQKTVVVLEIAGEQRSIWLLFEALFNQFRQEISTRPGRKLDVGERVTVHRLGERVAESSGRTYMDFRAHFPDRPEPTADDLWGADVSGQPAAKAEPAGDEKAAGDVESDDDIPF